jgi:hypothetical protein
MRVINWLLENIWAAVIIVAVLDQLRKAVFKKKGGAEDGPPPHEERNFEDPELAERTRKIREEIQRKIAERARGYPTEQPTVPRDSQAEPPPVVREVIVPEVPSVLRPGASRLEAQRHAEILEEQATLAERLREAELMKAAALKRTRYETATADHSAAARTLSRSSVLVDLRDPEALRRAFILREVLGPPVALR